MPIVSDGALENSILVGKDADNPLYSYTNRELSIGSVKGTFNCDVISNELPIDTFSFIVRYDTSTPTVYLTRDTKQAYVCDGYVPGTLESCGWIATVIGANVAGNVITTSGGFNWVIIAPPENQGGSPKFHAGDVVKLKLSVVPEDSNSKVWVSPDCHYSIVEMASATDYFSITNVVYTYETIATTRWSVGEASYPGEDELTITYLQDTDQYLYIRGDYVTSVTVSGIQYNGEMVYGSLYGHGTDADSPKLYILSSRDKTPEKEYLKNLPFGTPVEWYCGTWLIAKGYVKSIERTSATTWKITCVSGIGLLDERMHPGGIYTGQKFSTVFADIVGDSFKYVWEGRSIALKNMSVFGWLPYDTARNNLHRLLFAMGATLKRTYVTREDE